MQAILSFLAEIFSQPAFLMGLIAFVGLVALRSPGNKLLTGTLKPILGYLMLSAGAGVIVANLNPLGGIIEAGFNIRGVIPNNEAIVSVAQKMLGVETMSILLLGFIFNLIIARCTKYKYIFLTGHHSFFLACLFSAVLQAAEFHGWMLILIGGFLLGSWSAISPAIGQRYTRQVTEDGGIAMGHFGSLGYYLSAWIASRTGNPANSFADTEISEKWGFLRDTTVTTGIVMFVIYFVCSAVAGSAYLSTITDQNMLIFSVLTGLQFAVGVAIVYNGVRLILGDLVPAFQGISQKLIPDSIPAVDCAVFFRRGGGIHQLLRGRAGRDALARRAGHGADYSRHGAALLLRRHVRRLRRQAGRQARMYHRLLYRGDLPRLPAGDAAAGARQPRV